ncbi:MAG TPA: acetyl-CoA C-acyltransferase [Gammaproteobacteria bacterium]|nr:acetyl-CoA C-acyltransferase [Gammaproteobacteria bacterium]
MVNDDPIVIVSCARTPIGNFQGVFKNTTAPELGAVAIKAALERAQLKPEMIHEVLMGCVLPAGLGQAPARQAALGAGLLNSTGCTTVNKMCGSGMKTVMLAHDALLADSENIIIAGGMESMTHAPYLLPKARAGYRLGHQTVVDHMLYDGLEDAYQKGSLMGVFAEECAEQYYFTREAQDQFAITSVLRAKQAQVEGSFDGEIAPVVVTSKQGETLISADEGPGSAQIEKIPQLKPAFRKDGTVTAANASSISDGAAALVLMRRSEAERLGLTPLATMVGHQTHAQEPNLFTTAPIGAIQKLLRAIHWSVDDVDLYEINEAFAVVTMAAMHDLQLPHEKVNVHGGACVLGHPIGASGARILVTLLYALKKYDLKRGVAALCIGGGEATAVAVEL